MGTDGVQQALKALKGGQNEAKIGTGFTVITKSNIDSPEGKAVATRPAAERFPRRAREGMVTELSPR